MRIMSEAKYIFLMVEEIVQKIHISIMNDGQLKLTDVAQIVGV